MKIRNAIIALTAIASLVTACTAAQLQTATTITQSGEGVCEVVLTVADPLLAPLCTTVADVESAIQALIAVATPVTVADAGVVATQKLVVTQPTTAQVYQYLLAHGAKTVAVPQAKTFASTGR